MISVTVAVLLFCLSSVLAMPYELVENEDGEAFAMVPIDRVRRQTSAGVDSTGRVTVGHGGTLFRNDNHRVDGSAYVSKQFNPSGPLGYGGQLGYTHTPSGSNLNLGAAHTRGFGTDVSAQGTYNIYHDRRNTLGATGHYSRHFGGPFGTGRPNYGVGLQYQHRF